MYLKMFTVMFSIMEGYYYGHRNLCNLGVIKLKGICERATFLLASIRKAKSSNLTIEFPKFYGKDGESGQDFLDSFELSCVLAKKYDPTFLLKLFPLALRSEAREWYNGINKSKKED